VGQLGESGEYRMGRLGRYLLSVQSSKGGSCNTLGVTVADTVHLQ
jgi:hypothetical protein